MRRKEEKLKDLLESGIQSGAAGSRSGLRERIVSGLKPLKYPSLVKEQPVEFSARAFSLAEDLEPAAAVIDGLGSLGDASVPVQELLSVDSDLAGAARQIGSLDAFSVINCQLPEESSIRVRHEDVKITSSCHRLPVELSISGAKSLEGATLMPPVLKDGGKYLFANTIIQSMTKELMDLPYVRAGIRLDRVNGTEKQGFLQEAKALKGIPPDRAEILAIFRHVPIAMVSRLRFVADKKAIVYAVSRETRQTQTRVHDVAVIRDTVSHEIHLVPHRAQFRSVALG